MAVSQINGNRQVQAASLDKTRVDATIIRADGVNAFTADQPFGGFKITGLANGVSATDAATVAQVDAARQGIIPKDPVRAATTANITLSGTQTVDGVSLSVGNRVLVKDQSAGADNGIYLVASGAWTRALDASISAEVLAGMTMWVNEGTVNGDKMFILTTNDPITLGTTALVFTMFAGGTSYIGGAGIVLTGSTFDVVAGDTSLTVAADSVSVNLAASGGLEVSSGLKVKLDGATLALGASGIKVTAAGITATEIAAAVAGDGLTGGAGTALAVNMLSTGGLQTTTDQLGIKLNGTSLLLAAGGVSVNPAKWIVRETPTGLVNGSNTTYTLANTPIAGSEEVFVNGLLQEPGAGNDYTISGATITSLVVLQTGDKIRARYMIA